MKRQRCDETSQTNSFCIAKFVVDVIVNDDSHSGEAASAVELLTHPEGMTDDVPVPVLSESMDNKADGRADIVNDQFDDV